MSGLQLPFGLAMIYMNANPYNGFFGGIWNPWALNNTEVEEETIPPVDTRHLLSSILSSDTDKNGQASLDEITSGADKINNRTNYLNMVKLFMPFCAPMIDAQIKQMESQLNVINLVKDNYDTFAKAGKTTDTTDTDEAQQIDTKSLLEIVKAANSDGNIYDFSSDDLADLQEEESS